MSKKDKAEKAKARASKSDKSDKAGKSAKLNKLQGAADLAKLEDSGKAAKAEKAAKPTKTEKAARLAKPQKLAKSIKPAKLAKEEKSSKPEKAAKEVKENKAEQTTPMDDQAMLLISRALSDPRRVEVLRKIATSDKATCGDVRTCIGMNAATLSHHMRQLETAGLIETERDGKFVRATLRRKTWKNYLAHLKDLTD